ncbi:MAG: diacylglycerol kinase [Alphaproteobacteria bacterium]|nr:diacylglycerol kinase [Alphaproteobacteria bacterium]
MTNKKKGLNRIMAAFKNSWNGLRAVAQNEAAFRQELFMCVIGVIVLTFANITMTERVVLAVSMVCVLVAELVNSAIENIVDRIGPEYHELSGRAKDIGSAIVLLTITAVVCVWLFVFFA